MQEWRALTDLVDGLTEAERERLKVAIDDIVVDTPASARAALTMLLPKIGKDANEATRQILIAVATTPAKQQLGL
jgi:hypothetical protein